MSPYQHGEVFVTDDGAETDLDLGHYERFTGIPTRKNDNVTSGKIYSNVSLFDRSPESHSPLFSVDVWGMDELFFHLTVSPIVIIILSGENE